MSSSGVTRPPGHRPPTPREIYLAVALAVARGLPDPAVVSVGDDDGYGCAVHLDFSLDRAVYKWAAWLGTTPVRNYAGVGLYASADAYPHDERRELHWRWVLRGPRQPNVPPPTPAEQTAADELLELMLSTDQGDLGEMDACERGA